MHQFTKNNPLNPWIKAVEMYRNIETNELSSLLNAYQWTDDDIGNEGATCSTTTAISPDERYLAVGYAMGTPESANKSTFDENKSSLVKLNDTCIFNSLATDASIPRQSRNDRICVRIFEIFTGRAVCVKHLVCTTDQATKITCLAWSFDQKYLYAGNQDCTILWFDVKRIICTPIKQMCVNSSCKEYVITRLLPSKKNESKILVVVKPKKSKSNVRGHNSNDRKSHSNRLDKIQNSQESLVYLLDTNNDDFAPVAKNYAVKAAIFVNDDQDILLFISESNNIVDHERKATSRSKMQSSKKNQAMLIYNIDTRCIRATSAPFPTDFNNVKVDSSDLRFEWLCEIKRILVSSNIGFYFIDLDDTYSLPTLFHSKFIDGRYQNFHCGKILSKRDGELTYLLGFRDHDKDPGGREKNSICVWNIWNPVQMINCPITIPKTKNHQKNDYFSCMNVQNSFRSALFFTSIKGRLACFRKIRSVSLEWGGAMFPARFQVIDVNRRYVESESEFDKNLEHSDKIAETQNRGKLNVLLARDKPEIKETVSSSTYLFARPSKNISLLISEGSDTVDANPTTSELRPKPDTGEIKKSCRSHWRLGNIPGFNSTSQKPHNEIYHGIFRSSGGQKSHLSDKVSPLSDNNTSKRFHKTLSPKIIDEEDDPAKIMQEVHVDKLLEYALQRKEKLSETPTLVPRLAQHYSQYVDAYINSLSCDDFKLFLLLAKPSSDQEDIMAHFPGLTRLELTRRAKRLGFQISYSKYDEKLHREILKPNTLIKNKSKGKCICDNVLIRFSRLTPI